MGVGVNEKEKKLKGNENCEYEGGKEGEEKWF